MKFILCEDIETEENVNNTKDNNAKETSNEVANNEDDRTPEEQKVDDIVKNVDVELKEGFGYNQTILDDAKKISNELSEFIDEVKDNNEYIEFLSLDNINRLIDCVDILSDFAFGYGLYARKQARKFIQSRKDKEHHDEI